MKSKVEKLHSRAEYIYDMFEQGGETRYINETIDLNRKALKLCPPGHPMRYVSLCRLATHLGHRYDRLGATRDLEEAIFLGRQTLNLCPQGHSAWSMVLNNLAMDLLIRYRRLGGMQDLVQAIVLGREALYLRPQGHPDRSMSLNNLAFCLFTSYEQIGEIQDLGAAITLCREALHLRPPGHPNRPMSLNNLSGQLSTRYGRLGAMRDLDEAIALNREALDIYPEGHPDRSISLNNLADDLSTRYQQFGEMQDLNEAVVLDREALHSRPQEHPHRSSSLNCLANRLSTRYEQLGEIQDLIEAIALDREALHLRPQGHLHRSTSLNILAVHLSMRYEQLGTMQDIEEAILLDREALALCSQGRPDRSMLLHNLAGQLSARYLQLGAMQDLEEAIVLDQEALDLCTQGDPHRSGSLNSLANCLYSRYKEIGEMQDLEKAIVLHREALCLRPQGHTYRSMALNNLASSLFSRYEQLWEMRDLEEAIVLSREAVSHCRKGQLDQSTLLISLASYLHSRHKRLGAMQDLEEAIVLGREVVDLCPQGHPGWSGSLDNLAHFLRSRFARLKQLEDMKESFSLYTRLVHVTQIVFSKDLFVSRAWIQAAQRFQHPTLLLAYGTSLRLLVQYLATLPSLPQHLGILKKLTSSLAVDAFSACLRNHAPARAVELLEQGRGVFWSQLTRLYSPLADVIVSSPAGKALADEFTRVALLIRGALNSPGADQHGRLCRLNLEMQKIVTSIRELPGLSRFLLPSLFTDLQRAASGGPVIIVNASMYSCDALVVLLDRDPVHIPLQITQEDVRDLSTELHTLTMRATRADMTRELASFLRKLWDQIVSPIVDFLQTTLSSQSRIWWCPTAEFSLLPLHASGPYRKGQRNLPDLYISSYTSTLSALIRARRPNPSNSATQQKRFVAIGQAKAAGENELFSVGAELDNIGQRVSSLATFTRIDGEESSISRVVEELGNNEWIHLACHGLPSRKQPFESAFALHDGHFTIQRIIGCDLKNPEFAYLSACHTTVGDEESPDEVIHLASAMQFLGFRSVIGTMWAVDDGETNRITSTFYKYMVDESGRLDHTRAAFALNKTMKSANIPFDQRIPYIHLGA